MNQRLLPFVAIVLVGCGPEPVTLPLPPTPTPGVAPAPAAQPGSPAPGPGGVSQLCSRDADCAVGERCEGSELLRCVPHPVDAGMGGGAGGGAGGGSPPQGIGVMAPVDASCSLIATPPTEYPAKWPLLAPTAPAGCRSGFELNNPYNQLAGKRYTVHAKTAQGSRELLLELDFATYQAPDGLKITGTLAGGQTYVLFETCRMQTAPYYDPTDGQSRPPEDSIRDYRLALKAGTVKLDFDYGRATTPTYAKTTGLCDFTLTPATPTMLTSLAWWRSF